MSLCDNQSLRKSSDLSSELDKLLVMFSHKLPVGPDSLLPVRRTCCIRVKAK